MALIYSSAGLVSFHDRKQFAKVIFSRICDAMNAFSHPSVVAAATILAALLVSSCGEEELETAGFTTNRGSANESAGSQSITIELGGTTTTSTTISYSVGGNARLDGDYRLTSRTGYFTTGLAITVPAGVSQATLDFDLIDDDQIERENELIYFAITSVSDQSLAKNITHTTLVFEITDDDTSPDDALQIDLSWDLGDGVRINGANFDLYLANDIALDNGVVTGFTAVNDVSSANDSGFETVLVSNDFPDGQYYAIIDFLSGESAAELWLNFNSENISRVANGQVAATSVGKKLYFGPITKTGSNYAFN